MSRKRKVIKEGMTYPSDDEYRILLSVEDAKESHYIKSIHLLAVSLSLIDENLSSGKYDIKQSKKKLLRCASCFIDLLEE